MPSQSHNKDTHRSNQYTLTLSKAIEWSARPTLPPKPSDSPSSNTRSQSVSARQASIAYQPGSPFGLSKVTVKSSLDMRPLKQSTRPLLFKTISLISSNSKKALVSNSPPSTNPPSNPSPPPKTTPSTCSPPTP